MIQLHSHISWYKFIFLFHFINIKYSLAVSGVLLIALDLFMRDIEDFCNYFYYQSHWSEILLLQFHAFPKKFKNAIGITEFYIKISPSNPSYCPKERLLVVVSVDILSNDVIIGYFYTIFFNPFFPFGPVYFDSNFSEGEIYVLFLVTLCNLLILSNLLISLIKCVYLDFSLDWLGH